MERYSSRDRESEYMSTYLHTLKTLARRLFVLFVLFVLTIINKLVYINNYI